MKKVAKKSRLYLFWLKTGSLPAHDQSRTPDYRRDRSLVALLPTLQSDFLNAKTNKADPKATGFQLVMNKKTELLKIKNSG